MFYERYLQLCEKNRLAPSAAADRAGFNRGTVSVWKKKYEAGQDVRPEKDVIEKICGLFGCSEPWLLGIEDNKKTPTVSGEREELKELVFSKLENADPAIREAALRLLGIQELL